jgi:WD40 repeat protein/DNA-binding SARP family transcriptional activator
VDFRILGPLEVARDGEPLVLGAAQQRALLAVLVLHRGELVPVDRLVDQLWGEQPPAAAAKTVQVYVSQLRKALGAGVIVTQGRAYRLAAAPGQVDAARFEALAAEGRRALAADDAARARQRLCTALGLWRGEPLADFTYEAFAQAEIGRLQEARLAALEDRIEADLALGADGELVGEIDSLIAANPLAERLRGQLMLALYRAGRQADALAAYRQASELLREELGLEPGRSLQELERSILEHDPCLDGPRGVAAASEGEGMLGTVAGSPYRGLSAFEEQDAAFFFGREMASAQVLERMSRRLEGTGLLVVSGVSGAGKSSLLRAGVLPRIRETGLAFAPGSRSWPCLLFTPTRAPLDELALHVALLAGADASAVRRGLAADPAGFALTARQAALAEPHRPAAPAEERDRPPQRRLLLVVDQFEQLFTQCADEGQRRAFLTALHAAASARHGPHQPPAALVVLGVRADFEARCADYPQLTDAVQDRYLVTSMTERQLRLAISEPAKKAGSKVEDDLVGVLLAEVRNGQPGAFGAGVLPLLSHALDQAWRCRAGETVALGDYERTGGIEGAVADSAQRTYDRLTPAQQGAARHVFTRLITISSEGVDCADRATRAELTEGKNTAEAQDVETVLEAFAAQRLLTLAAGTVEISHEALLTAWPLLHDTWLAETHADRIVRTQLHNTAAEWARQSHDLSYLYSGSLLQAANETAARIGADPARHPPLSQTERDFLHASGHARRRRAWQRQAFLAFLLALIVGLASATVLAVRASQQAAHQRDVVASGQLISESENLGDTDPAISALLAIAAWRIDPSSAARYAMLAAAARPAIAVLSGYHDTVLSVAFSPDGKTLASGSGDGTVRLSNLATHQQIGSPLTGTHRAVNSVAFSPGGTTLASGGDDDTVRLWDLATHRQIGRPLTGHGGSVVLSVAFSPGGTTLASGSLDGTVRLWDVATHQQAGRLRAGGAAILSVAFSPGGTTLATGNNDGTVRLWDLATHRQIGGPLTGHGGPVNAVAFSPGGTTLASGSDDHTVRLWDLATGRQIGSPLTGHGGPVYSVAFSPDGKTLATGNDDGTVRLWDLATHRQIGSPLNGHSGANVGVSLVAFSPDGKTLATGGDGNDLAWLWDLATHQQIGSPLTGNGTAVSSIAFSPDAKTLATGNTDGTAWLWDLATHQQIGSPLTGNGSEATSIAFSPGGKTLATGGDDGTVRLWDLATHRQIGSPLTGHNGPVYAVAFSPDGKTLASGNTDGTVRLWDLATHRQIGSPLTGTHRAVNSVAFSPDGTTLASGSDDKTIRTWNVTYVAHIVPDRYLCASAGRSLTRAEWARYVPPGLAYQKLCP